MRLQINDGSDGVVSDGTGSGATPFGTNSMGNLIQNPPFDGRAGTRGAVDDQGRLLMLPRSLLRRGYMANRDPDSHGNRYLVNFQFNPTDFTHSMSANSEIPLGGFNDGGSGQFGDILKAAPDSGQSLSFNLLFDRTYDAWVYDGSYAATQGVLTDIKTLYGLFGMYTSKQSGTYQDPSTVSLAPTGLMQPRYVWISFAPGLAYFGVVQSCDVQVTHFTQRMVPVRAAVNLSIAIFPTDGTSNSLADLNTTQSLSPQALRKWNALELQATSDQRRRYM